MQEQHINGLRAQKRPGKGQGLAAPLRGHVGLLLTITGARNRIWTIMELVP
jgi:hypothetical protein